MALLRHVEFLSSPRIFLLSFIIIIINIIIVHLAPLGRPGILLEDTLDVSLLLDALHQILVRRPVHASDSLHHEFRHNQRNQLDQHRRPPSQPATEILDKGVPNDVWADCSSLNPRQRQHPDEPSGDGDEEPDKGDNGFAVEFEDPGND